MGLQDADRIDLHTHSFFSDGTDSPDELIDQAKLANLQGVALTDHDSTQGWALARNSAIRNTIAFVPGIELSTTDLALSDQGSVHLLGYFFDPTYEPLETVCTNLRTSRQHRARAMVERLAKEYAVTWEDVVSVAKPGASIGRPHIADALIRKGIVPNRESAFRDMLHSDKEYYTRIDAPDVHEGVELIIAAGGVCVLAHPATGSRNMYVPEFRVKSLTQAGLSGLEIGHRENTAQGRAYLSEMVQKYGLVSTGSSDYHGDGKPNRLGENTTSSQALERLRERAGRAHELREYGAG